MLSCKRCRTTNRKFSYWKEPKRRKRSRKNLSPQSSWFRAKSLWLKLLESQDFLFLPCAKIFDLLGLGVGNLFQLIQRAFLFVFADFLLFFELFDRFLDVAPDIANGG